MSISLHHVCRTRATANLASRSSSRAGPSRIVNQSVTRFSPSNCALHGKGNTSVWSLQHHARHLSISVTRSLISAEVPTKRSFFDDPAKRPAAPFEFLVGYAFAGKPRHDAISDSQQGPEEGKEQEPESTEDEPAPSSPKNKEIGFPPATPIGKWRDALLEGGEAGEDALICAAMGTRLLDESSMEPQLPGSGDVVIGVADGVGGWTEQGVDPSLFSQALMYHATMKSTQYYACPDRIELDDTSAPPSSTAPKGHPGTPSSILEYAYGKVLTESAVEAGSSTACIITLDSTKGVLRSANLGDSGFVILRQGAGVGDAAAGAALRKQQAALRTRTTVPGSEQSSSASSSEPGSSEAGPIRTKRQTEGVLYASEPLQLGFNTPYQLSKVPARWEQDSSISNVPSDAREWECRLRDGDLVVVGTDGLFDNVHLAEIVQLTRFIREKHHAAWNSRHVDPNEAAPSTDPLEEERAFVQVLAHNLVEYTRMCQFSQTKRSPFEVEAARYGIRYPGGKVDDVAVCLALVKEK